MERRGIEVVECSASCGQWACVARTDGAPMTVHDVEDMGWRFNRRAKQWLCPTCASQQRNEGEYQDDVMGAIEMLRDNLANTRQDAFWAFRNWWRPWSWWRRIRCTRTLYFAWEDEEKKEGE